MMIMKSRHLFLLFAIFVILHPQVLAQEDDAGPAAAPDDAGPAAAPDDAGPAAAPDDAGPAAAPGSPYDGGDEHTTVVGDGTKITKWIPVDFDYVGNLCGIFSDQTGESKYNCGDYYLACCNQASKGAECALPARPSYQDTQCDTTYSYVGCCVVPNHPKSECTVLANGKMCSTQEYAVCFGDGDELSDQYVLADGVDNQQTTCKEGDTPYCCPPTEPKAPAPESSD